jgi:hypothetical protein
MLEKKKRFELRFDEMNSPKWSCFLLENGDNVNVARIMF